MKISVIIPAWGKTPYLEKAAASVRAQTCSGVELVFAAPPQGGPQTLPAARLAGLEKATGEWIAFCDADDWLDLQAMERMAASAVGEVDVVCCGMVRERANGTSLVKPFDPDGPSDTFNSLSNKLFRKCLFDGVFVDREVALGEDVMVTAQALAKARRIAVLDEAFYHYRETPLSMTRARDGRKRVLDLAKVGRILRDRLPDAKYDDFHDRVTRDALLLWIRCRLFDRSIWRELRGRLKGGLLSDPRHGLIKKGALACASCLFD